MFKSKKDLATMKKKSNCLKDRRKYFFLEQPYCYSYFKCICLELTVIADYINQ